MQLISARGYWNNEIDETIVNHSSVLTARAGKLMEEQASGKVKEQFPREK